jgi:hypothetical protein
MCGNSPAFATSPPTTERERGQKLTMGEELNKKILTQ